MPRTTTGADGRRAVGTSEPSSDAAQAADDLLTQARHLAAMAFGTTTSPELAAAAEGLQACCAGLVAAAPSRSRRRRARALPRLEALALAADDLAAVVLLRCCGGEREVGGIDVGALLTRVADRHAAVREVLPAPPAALLTGPGREPRVRELADGEARRRRDRHAA